MNTRSVILFAVITISLVIGNFAASRHYISGLYPLAACVSDLDFESDSVLFTDLSGHEWSAGGINDWMLGDSAVMIMDSCGTEEVSDDRIVSVRYAG